MKILAFESSCDETSCAVIENGRRILSDVISSQVPIHKKFGGVVPEIASRHHIEDVLPVAEEALSQAGCTWNDMDAIAVTQGPGLVGALLVGVAAAKAVGKARGAGTVDVYVSAPDGIPSEKLLTELQTVFQKSREIAVNVQVKAPTAATVDMAVTVKTAEGTDFANVKTAVEADLAEQFNGKLLGRGVKLAELNSRIYALPGVENCHITAPSADLAANDTVLPVLGTVTVTEEA